MAVKHQSRSYRNRGGVKYTSWEDFPDMKDGSEEANAMELVEEIRASGERAFRERGDGYWRVFKEA